MDTLVMGNELENVWTTMRDSYQKCTLSHHASVASINEDNAQYRLLFFRFFFLNPTCDATIMLFNKVFYLSIS